MKIGRVVPMTGPMIPLIEEVRSFLGLRPHCQLNIVSRTLDNPSIHGLEILFSTIPFQAWGTAYQIDISLPNEPGSQLQCAERLREARANILISECVAAPQVTRGNLTMILEFEVPPKVQAHGDEVLLRHLDERAARLKASFESLAPTHSIRVTSGPTRLKQLARIHSDAREAQLKHYPVSLHGYALNLPEELYKQVIRVTNDNHLLALVSADTEDWVGSIVLLPAPGTLWHVDFEIDWQGEGLPIGVYEQALKVLGAKKVNILRSFNYVLEKSPTRDRAVVHLIGFAPQLVQQDAESIRRDLQGIAIEDLAAIRHGRGPATRAAGVQNVKVYSIERYRARCFLARPVSAKNTEQLDDLTDRLVGLGFEIETGELTDGDVVRENVRQKIGQCVCLVSLGMVDEGRKLAECEKYAPSEWMVYEQEVASALDIPVFQIRDRRLVDDPVLRGQEEPCWFDVDGRGRTFENALGELERRIRNWMLNSEKYPKVLAKVAKRLAGS